MAFDIRNLFGPAGFNMLMQPRQNAVGAQNMLMTQPGPSPMPIAPMQAAPMQVDPQTTAAMAGPAPVAPQNPVQVAAGPSSPFGLDPDRKQFLQDMFLGWAAGKDPSQSLALGAAQAASGRRDRKGTNQTVDWLKGKGMDEASARQLAANPSALGDYIKQLNSPQDPMKALNLEKTQLEIEGLRNGTSGLTSDQKEYQAAKNQGFNGSFMDYQVKMKEAGRNQVNIDTGAKLPSGFRWIDPSKQELGVEPIPGGPGEQIPGELAARIGMGENFLTNDLPVLRKQESLDAATGPIDRMQAWAGIGKPAEIERKFQSGTEVLSRLLSGAGMTQVEIDEKTKRYMPTISDTPASLQTKLNQLEAEITASGNAAMRGRGGSIMPQPAAGGVRKYNPATGRIE